METTSDESLQFLFRILPLGRKKNRGETVSEKRKNFNFLSLIIYRFVPMTKLFLSLYGGKIVMFYVTVMKQEKGNKI